MFLTRSEYGKCTWKAYKLSNNFHPSDRGVNTFSPEGRLFQGTGTHPLLNSIVLSGNS